MPEVKLDHANHAGIVFERAGSELRATVMGGQQANLANVGSASGGQITYTLQAKDNGTTFVYHGPDAPIITVPAELGSGFRAAFVLRPPKDALATLVPSGSWHASSPVGPLEFAMGTQADGPIAFTLTVQSYGGQPLMHVTGSSSRPFLARVFYDAGWPSSRPAADHVDAIGGTAKPEWLTGVDAWWSSSNVETGDAGDPVVNDIDVRTAVDNDGAYARFSPTDSLIHPTDRFYMTSEETRETVNGVWFAVPIPQGATITDAKLTIYEAEVIPWEEVDQFQIGIEQTDNAAHWASHADAAARYANVGTTKIENPLGTFSDGHPHVMELPVAMLQEIVSRAGWASGNHLAFMLYNEVNGMNNHQWHAHQNVPAEHRPRLQVEFTT